MSRKNIHPSQDYPVHKAATPDGWTDPIQMVTKGFRLACCDCGLTHELDFDGSEENAIQVRVRRANRSTANIRRYKDPIYVRTFLRYARRCVVATYMTEPAYPKRLRKRFIKSLAKELGLDVRFD